jgi:large subunit ribosomal protein L19
VFFSIFYISDTVAFVTFKKCSIMNNEVAALLLAKYGKKNPPTVKSGDTVRVHQKIKEGDKERVQIFEGLVICTKHGHTLDGTFTVRKIAVGGIGVERTYPLHSPNVLKVERIKIAEVNRSKLYYMRDRKGKSARFKNEVRDNTVWDETSAAASEESEAAAEHSEEVVVQPEGTVEMEALESARAAEVAEAPTDEAVDLEAAVIETAPENDPKEEKKEASSK